MPEEELLRRFIVRERQFQLLWEDIADSKLGKIDQHFLIIGQRGMGKTTLMLKTAYEIRRDPKLKDWLVPVPFPEELFGVTDLTGLWLALAEVLDQDFPGIFDELQALLHKQDESVLLEAIRRRLNQPKRKLVIFIDNFGDLLDRLNEIEVHRLREVLMNARDLRLVAASARVIDHTYRYDKPFFDFFNTIHLPELSKEESKTLMQELSDQAGKRDVFDALIAKHPGRIEAIRRLTGGVPRLLLLLFSSLVEEGDTELMDDLEAILDQVSPYYKHRVEELQSQQRSIFHHVAMAWDAVSTAEIASSTRLESKKVSAQLQQMAEGGILERVETGGKNHLYRLQERFFNIWYLMRMAGNRGAERMKWLVAFFETWLEGGALKQKLEHLAEEFRADGNLDYATGIETLLEQQQFEEKEPKPTYTSPELLPYNLRLRNAHQWSDLLKITDELQKEGISPNVVTFNTAWVQAKSHADFITVLETFKQTWKVDTKSSIWYKDGREDACRAIIHLWDNNFMLAHEIATSYFKENGPFGQHMLYQEFYLLELLIRYQTHECYSLFESSPHRLKDVFKPIWYALLKLMGEKGRKEYLRMGPELEETVSEIVDFVEKMRVKYPH